MPHALLVHPALRLTGTTERTLAIGRVLLRQGFRVTVLTRDGSRRQAFDAAGLDLRFAELPADPAREPFAVRRTLRSLQDLQADVLHVTHSSLAPLGAWLARRLDRPYVLELGRAPRQHVARDDEHLRAAVLTCSTLLEAAVNRGGLAREKVRVLPHGPEAPPLVAAERAPGTPLRIGFTGTLSAESGTEVFLEAARPLAASGRDLLFFFLGEGPQELELRRRVRECELTSQVTITAPACERVEDLLAMLDVHVCSNLDGVPDWLSHLALAMGLPSVMSAVSSSFELLRESECALLVERGRPLDLAREVARLADDPALARRLGRAARERSLELAVGRRFEEGVLGVYEGVLGAVR